MRPDSLTVMCVNDPAPNPFWTTVLTVEPPAKLVEPVPSPRSVVKELPKSRLRS